MDAPIAREVKGTESSKFLPLYLGTDRFIPLLSGMPNNILVIPFTEQSRART